MYHRYGRHGPHAWRRWREKRFARRPTDVVYVAHVTIFQLQLSLSLTERTIIIVDSDTHDLNEGSDGTTTTKSLSGPEKRREPLLQYAEHDARKHAKQDFERPGGPLPEENTLRYASQQGDRRIEECIGSGQTLPGDSEEDAHEEYIKTFMSVYERKITSLGATIPNKETWEIQKIARIDKKDDGDSLLLSDLFIYKATIRAKEYLLLSSSLHPRELERIKRVAKLYEEEYRNYTDDPALEKEETRPNGSSRFPTNPNGYQY